jgi:hypothetical protein
MLRYSLRYQAYLVLLTPTQPFKGFFGDENESGSDTSDTHGASTLPTNWRVIKSAKVLVVIALILSVPMYALQRVENSAVNCRNSTSTSCLSLASRAPERFVALAQPISVANISATVRYGQSRRLFWANVSKHNDSARPRTGSERRGD